MSLLIRLRTRFRRACNAFMTGGEPLSAPSPAPAGAAGAIAAIRCAAAAGAGAVPAILPRDNEGVILSAGADITDLFEACGGGRADGRPRGGFSATLGADAFLLRAQQRLMLAPRNPGNPAPPLTVIFKARDGARNLTIVPAYGFEIHVLGPLHVFTDRRAP